MRGTSTQAPGKRRSVQPIGPGLDESCSPPPRVMRPSCRRELGCKSQGEALFARSNTMRFFAVVLMVTVLGTPVAGQHLPLTAQEQVDAARFRFGPVVMDPSVALTNFGWDSNVLNSAIDPNQDFTATVTPGLSLWLRMGRAMVSLNGAADLVYFAEFESQRSLNSRATGQYEYGFNRIRPYASVRTVNTRDQPGFEIEARVRHYETEFQSGADFRVGSKTNARVNFRHIEYTFDSDATYGGRPLNEELNRTLRGINVDWRQRLTALTTWLVQGVRETERFRFDQSRNSNSLRISTGFELGRFALIRGRAIVGYRRLAPAEGGTIPEFSGLTADVNVAYTAPFETRLSANVVRDVQYSYERASPYYVQTSWTGTLTKRVIRRWDVQLTGGQDRLAYRVVAPTKARTDVVGRVGGGIGYSVGEDVRIGFDVQSLYRSSELPGREYGTIRGGLSVTYGF